MSNKELFINTYLDKIAGKFNINKDQVAGIISMKSILDQTFDKIYANVIIANSANKGTNNGN